MEAAQVMPTAWFTVVQSKVVYRPFETGRVNEAGEAERRFSRIGVRVDMADESWWFFSFRHGTWSCHNHASKPTGNFQEFVIVEQTTVYTPRQLARDYADRPLLLAAVNCGYDGALADEAAKFA